MTMKRICTMVVLVFVISNALMLAVCCAKAAASPGSAESKTFSKYGFSFQYPEDFLVFERGLLENEANETSGIVQAGVENEETRLLQVSWIKTLQYSLEGGLAGGFAGLEGAKEMASLEKGELVEATKAGHRMLYQYYTATSIEGSKAYGVLAVFHCHKSQKAYVLMTVNTDISAKTTILEDFQSYLDPFVCH